uniref:leukocyte receptor cluster member 9 isoform X2 n=1 Tax=Gasterosteus aculeatus aculeatus TaxID=481459 RepID=UPI001A981BF1|nr:leukocyte receptor cluster member 9 isoform X2 [Gasterosteus aculeatus aculeatus]
MASEGSGVASVPSEDRRDEGTHPADTRIPEAKVSLKAPAESAARDENGILVCQFFLMGKCRFGPKCRFSHSDSSVDDSGAVSPDRDDKQDGEKTEKHKKKVNKATTPKSQAKEVKKKPRMRTAEEVISRILWDPSVDGAELVVGYVDRFLGVLERPFNDFNWDTDPCDCDYSSELALPQHRIQYFLCRGLRVWDRHSRTDRVFGSTGQSLAPPFGGEGEVKEKNTEGQQQEQPPAEECAHAESAHLEEEKQSEMNSQAPDSSQAAPEFRGDASQEQLESQGTSGTEEAAVSSGPSKDQVPSSQKEEPSLKEGEKENSPEWKESWEGNEDASNPSQNPSAPLEQRETRGGRPAKKRPTHFITFKANTPSILSCFQQLQEEITSILPSSAPHWQPAASLHVTMCLLNLPGPDEVADAVEVLRRFARWDRNPPVSLTFPVRLKNFGGRVLYLSPQPQLHLQQLNGGLQEAYRREGWLHRDSYNPRYHLTLAKVVGCEGERVFQGVGELKAGKGLNFGRLPVNTLHLCSMGFSEEDGFYETVCTVTLR